MSSVSRRFNTGAPRHCQAIARACCRRMAVLNDFEANGYGVTAMDEKHLVTLNEVPAADKACKPFSLHFHCL